MFRSTIPHVAPVSADLARGRLRLRRVRTLTAVYPDARTVRLLWVIRIDFGLSDTFVHEVISEEPVLRFSPLKQSPLASSLNATGTRLKASAK
jgi:hypothetical protein